MRKSLKDEFTFSSAKAGRITRYYCHVPPSSSLVLLVVVERYCKTDLPEMEKKKFLVPRDIFVGQFIHILSSRLRLTPGKALVVFVKDTLPQTTAIKDAVYESQKDEDGFLHVL